MYLAVKDAVSQSLQVLLLVVTAEDCVAKKDPRKLFLCDGQHAFGELVELQLQDLRLKVLHEPAEEWISGGSPDTTQNNLLFLHEPVEEWISGESPDTAQSNLLFLHEPVEEWISGGSPDTTQNNLWFLHEPVEEWITGGSPDTT